VCREPLAKAVGKGGLLLFFLKKPVPRAPIKGRRQRLFFYLFEKIMCRAYLTQAVGKDSFLFF
jgi:hypothetical protein